MDFFLQFGFIGVFAGCFLAGSIVPFSSEILIAGSIALGLDPMWCFVAASLGNTAGGMTCYLMGRLGKMEWIHKWLRVNDKTIERYKTKVEGRGAWLALLAWLPYAGEAFVIGLGLVRSNWIKVSLYMLIGKAARYGLVILGTLGVISLL